MVLPLPSRAPATTLRRTLVCLLLGLACGAHGSEPVSELELVRRFLEAPVAVADLHAAEARARADRTAVSLLGEPALEVRHEEARGPAGATTDALGGSVSLDLGLSPLGYTRAARLRGSAGEHRRRAVALEAICGFRLQAVDLWSASRSASISASSRERLDALLETLGALAEAGEASGYDRDRAALAVLAHGAPTAARRDEAERLRAVISALVGGDVGGDVVLAEVPDLPDLPEAIGHLASHPALQALELERAAERVARDAARRDQLPDLTLRGGGRWDAPAGGGSATPGFEVGGAVQIPWTDGSRADARQRTADHADAEARLARATAELQASVRGAHRRVAILQSDAIESVEPDAVWEAAVDRYGAGEADLDELLQVAAAVEEARLALVARERQLRHAHLELSCATGRFAAPSMQSLLEEALR